MTSTHRTKLFLFFLAASGIAAAGDEVPVGRAEAMECRGEIAAYHDSLIRTYSGYVTSFCNMASKPGNEHEQKECAAEKANLQAMVDADDLQWWLKGNYTCWALYPCFGPDTYESDNILYKRGDMKLRAEDAPGGQKGGDDTSSRLHSCIAKAWLKRNPETDEDDKSEADSNDTRTATADPAEGSATAEKSDPIRAARCTEALAAQDAEFTAMNQRAPKPGSDQSLGGSKALYQMGMYVTGKRLELLDEFCQGEPQYAQYAPTKMSYESALTGCRQLANDGGESCKPLKLW
jgi:hypothetical protein